MDSILCLAQGHQISKKNKKVNLFKIYFLNLVRMSDNSGSIRIGHGRNFISGSRFCKFLYNINSKIRKFCFMILMTLGCSRRGISWRNSSCSVAVIRFLITMLTFMILVILSWFITLMILITLLILISSLLVMILVLRSSLKPQL